MLLKVLSTIIPKP